MGTKEEGRRASPSLGTWWGGGGRWKGFCAGAWLSQGWGCPAAPTLGVHLFISHVVGHLVGQAEDMRDLESSSQSIQLSFDYVAFLTNLKQELNKAVPMVCVLAVSLCLSSGVLLWLLTACSISRLASFHLLILPRTPTVPGPSCSVRPPAFPALKHIHIPKEFPVTVIVFLSLVCAQSLSCVQLSVTPWTIADQAPLSMGFPRQEYWSGLPFPPPGDLPNPGIKPTFVLHADSLPSEPPGKLRHKLFSYAM